MFAEWSLKGIRGDTGKEKWSQPVSPNPEKAGIVRSRLSGLAAPA